MAASAARISAVSQNAVEGCAQFVRQHQADVVAQIGQLLLRLLANRLDLFQPRFHRRIESIDGKRFGQIIVGAQLHAVAHAGIIGQAGHQNERNGSGRGLVAQ